MDASKRASGLMPWQVAHTVSPQAALRFGNAAAGSKRRQPRAFMV
jgi:hypothetical protein